MLSERPTFASFWAGETLSPYEKACLRSFTRRGYEVTLYSYDTIRELPEGVILLDASAVIDNRYASLYLIDGKPSLSHFSDIFRYKLFEKTGHIWIDSDMLLLREFDMALPKTLLAKEHSKSLCGAIMRLDRDSPNLVELLVRCENLAGRNLVWGETGPRLLTSVFGANALFAGAFEPELFYPIHFDFFWKPFLPEYFDECQEKCDHSYTVHLWNNIVVKLGVWKDFMPPVGSFLHRKFQEDETEKYFLGTYPAEVMRHMVENWLRRHDGAELGLKRLAKQLGPGIRITAQNRMNKIRLRLAR